MGGSKLLQDQASYAYSSQATLIIIKAFQILLLQISFPSLVTLSQGGKLKSGWSYIVCLAISLSSSSSKGSTLAKRRYIMTPNDQRSTSLP